MAIAKDGILGGFSGKVGNIVGLTLSRPKKSLHFLY